MFENGIEEIKSKGHNEII
jgi:hypothetical protein